jgi:hypothetical protein
MPPDNNTTIAPGADVRFPTTGPTFGTDITRTDFFTFNIVSIGTYQVFFQVSITEPGQLVVTINGIEQQYTVVGRATGTSQLVGMSVVETTSGNTLLTIRNPSGSAASLTITPIAGGLIPVTAHLIITRIS